MKHYNSIGPWVLVDLISVSPEVCQLSLLIFLQPAGADMTRVGIAYRHQYQQAIGAEGGKFYQSHETRRALFDIYYNGSCRCRRDILSSTSQTTVTSINLWWDWRVGRFVNISVWEHFVTYIELGKDCFHAIVCIGAMGAQYSYTCAFCQRQKCIDAFVRPYYAYDGSVFEGRQHGSTHLLVLVWIYYCIYRTPRRFVKCHHLNAVLDWI